MTTEQKLQKLLHKTTHTTLLQKDSKGNETLLDTLLNTIKKLKLDRKIIQELK